MHVSFMLKFLFRYFLHFLINKLTCTFQTLTAYLHEESDLCLFSIAYQQVLRLLFCLGAILVIPFFSRYTQLLSKWNCHETECFPPS